MEDSVKVATEIENLKARMDSTDKRFDKIDSNIQKIWERIDLHRESSIITQTLVENLRKDLSDSRIDNARNNEKISDKIDFLSKSINDTDKKQNTEWKNFWHKAAWALIGVIGSIIVYKLGLTK